MCALVTGVQTCALPIFGLPELRLQDGRVHFRQDLAGTDEVALVDQDLPDPARGLGRDIDLDRLDPAVSGGESVGQPSRLKKPPSSDGSATSKREKGDSPQPSSNRERKSVRTGKNGLVGQD